MTISEKNKRIDKIVRKMGFENKRVIKFIALCEDDTVNSKEIKKLYKKIMEKA